MTEKQTSRDRIAKLCILLACGVLLADLALALFRLAPHLGGWVRQSPETVLLADALVLLIATLVIRHV